MSEELLNISERLGNFTVRLTHTHNVYINAQAEGRAVIRAAADDPSPAGRAYNMLGEERHSADAIQWTASRRKQIEPKLSVDLFETEQLVIQGTDYLRRAIRDAQQAPRTEDAFRRYTNSLGVTADQMLLLALVDQATIANTRTELQTATPSRRVAMYRQASETPFEPVSATIIRMLESALPYPANVDSNPEQHQAAAELGRLIKEAKHARIPAEAEQVQEALDKARRAIAAAKAIGATPINPQHRPDVATKAAAIAEELELAVVGEE